MPPEIQFKKATLEDWQKFKDIRLKGLQTDPQAFGGVFKDESEQDDEYWKRRFADADRCLYGAEADGIFVATVGGKKVEDGVWTLSSVYTLPKWRGRGLSHELLVRVIEEVKNKGAKKIILSVNVEQESAINAYKKVGFEIVGEEKDLKLGDGLLHTEYHMEKKISDSNEETIQSYKDNFQKYIENVPQAFTDGEFKEWIDTFVGFLPNGSHIVELGSAGGRDARYLKSKGIEVLCTDVIPEALTLLEKDGFKTALYDFRDPFPAEWHDAFVGLFANAVLLHAKEDVFKKVIEDMKSIVKKDGVTAFSLLEGAGEEISLRRIDAPRYFKYHTKEEVEKLLLSFGYEILWIRHAENMKWLQVIVRNV